MENNPVNPLLMDTYDLDMSLQLACVKPPPPLS